MKYLILLMFLVGPSAMASKYGAARCQVSAEGIIDKSIDVFAGKFKAVQVDCCKRSLADDQACESREEYQKCKNGGKGTFNQVDSGVECSEGCKMFREDCDKFLDQSEIFKYL